MLRSLGGRVPSLDGRDPPTHTPESDPCEKTPFPGRNAATAATRQTHPQNHSEKAAKPPSASTSKPAGNGKRRNTATGGESMGDK